MDCWNIGMLEYGTQIHYSIFPLILLFHIFTTMSLFQWFFSSLFFLIAPTLALGAAATPVRVKIGTASFSSSTLSLWIAQERGIFTKHGIEAQTILIRGGPTLVASLMAGDINVAFTSGVSVLGAAAQGIDVKMLTSISSRVSWKLMAAPQIKTAPDLRGKRFGVQSIVGSTWMYSMLALEQLGLEPKRDNITFLPIGDPVTMAHALETGRIDAVVLDPVLSRGLMNKGFSLLLDLFRSQGFFPRLGFGSDAGLSGAKRLDRRGSRGRLDGKSRLHSSAGEQTHRAEEHDEEPENDRPSRGGEWLPGPTAHAESQTLSFIRRSAQCAKVDGAAKSEDCGSQNRRSDRFPLCPKARRKRLHRPALPR